MRTSRQNYKPDSPGIIGLTAAREQGNDDENRAAQKKFSRSFRRTRRLGSIGRRIRQTHMTSSLKTGYASVHGRRAYYEVHGSGEPRLVSVEMLGELLPELWRTRKVIALGWSGISKARLAILPGLTPYNIFSSPALARMVMPFLEAPVSRAK